MTPAAAEHWLWWAVAAVAVSVTTPIARSLLARRHARIAHANAQLLTIVPPPQIDPDGVLVWWAAMAEVLAPPRAWWLHGRPHTALEYVWEGRQLTINIWVPGTVHVGPVQAAVRGAWPGATVTARAASPPLPSAPTATGGTLTPSLPAWYLLRTDHDSDPLRLLVAAATGLHHQQTTCIQVMARPASARRVRRLHHDVGALRSGTRHRSWSDPATWLTALLDTVTGLIQPRHHTPASAARDSLQARADPGRDRDTRMAVDKLASTAWEVAIRYGIADTRTTPGTGPRLGPIADSITAAFGVWAGRNRLRRATLRQPADVLAARSLRHGFLLSADELASIAALPQDLAVPGLTRARAKPMPAPVAVPAGGRNIKVLGRADVGGHSVGIPVADARQHVHILGSTGSGKSTLMLNMILDDIHARRGVVVIDPKGDLVTDILDRLPATIADRLVLLDPDQNPGATFNPLIGDDDDLVVDNIVSIFSKIFTKHWGPRIDDTLRVSCLTLLRKAGAKLTLVPPLLNDRQLRHMYTDGLDDPEGLRGYWEWFESTPPHLRAQVIGPVLARLRAFLLRDFVKRTLGTTHSSFDMKHVLDGGILLARLPKGQIGEETSRLMGSFVLAATWQTATARTRVPEPERRDATIYIDEAHNFLNLPGSVADMLAEARGYHLSMVLAHQNLTQLPRDTQLALSANARTKIFFSCAPEDAQHLARHTLPELDDHDLSHMDAYRAAARILVDGRETPAFTLHTSPAKPVIGHAAAIRLDIAATMSRSNPRLSAIDKLARRRPHRPSP